MSVNINEIARKIAKLKPSDQSQLLEELAELSHKKGLKALASKYRQRLAKEGKLDQSGSEILAELTRIRRKIAAEEYGK
jgi:hypothetical protein